MATPKRWFITGASSGIGRALAQAALDRGDCVAATARQAERAADLADGVSGKVLPLGLELTDADSRQAAWAAAWNEFDGIDVLVNNAGITQAGCVEEVDDDVISRVFATNLFGPLALLRTALPDLRARRSGHVLNVSSTSGIVGLMGNGIYSASKFALEGLSEALRQELGYLDIAVTIIEPGSFTTGLIGAMDRATPIEDYRPVWEFLQQTEHGGTDTPPNDLQRGVQAILSAVDADAPPERLVLGSDGLDQTTEKLRAILAELEAWESVTRSVDA